MREIKFRAWNKENKRYNYYNLLNAKHAERWSNDMCDCEEPELFTGLKDKNGKEIYEGDIVKCNYCDKDFGIVTWLKDNARFGLNWDVKSCANARHVRIGCWCEVIGNIYENPELLNEMHSTLKK